MLAKGNLRDAFGPLILAQAQEAAANATRRATGVPSRLLVGGPSQPRAYSGYPIWNVLIAKMGREFKSAEMLIALNVLCYLPMFMKCVRHRGRNKPGRLCAVVPGLLFVPIEMLDIPRLEDVFEHANVRGYMPGPSGDPVKLSKAEVEMIRIMEAKLNLPPRAKGVLFKIGQRVRFTSDLYNAFWGTGVVFEVASEARIGIEVQKLFGRPTKVYVPASEIEAM